MYSAIIRMCYLNIHKWTIANTFLPNTVHPLLTTVLDHTIKRGVNRIHIDAEKVSFMC